MKTEVIKFETVDEYIATFSAEVQVKLEKLRTAIKQAAPEAKEIISYNMSAYKQNGMLVYFAAYKGHIGFYPTGSGIETFKNEITRFKTSKGAIQFPIDTALPITLVKKMVKFKISDDLNRVDLKLLKKK